MNHLLPHCLRLVGAAFVPAALVLVGLLVGGCQSAGEHRREANETAYSIVGQTQKAAFGEARSFSVDQPAATLRDRLLIAQDLPVAADASFGTDALEPTDHWPDDDYLDTERERPEMPGADPRADVSIPEREALVISLEDALRIAAHNSRDYQTAKERVFLAALALDLEAHAFDTTFSGILEGSGSFTGGEAQDTAGLSGSASAGGNRTFQSGATLTSALTVDLAKLLSESGGSSLGIAGDASVEIPLLRGAGRWVVAEPLIQAERNTLYAVYNFERFKREFAVRIASQFLGVLRQRDEVDNAEENYRGLITSARRIEALANEGRVPEIQVGQAVQDELRARNRWISSQASYQAALDALKSALGLPTDALIELDRDSLSRLAETAREKLPTAMEVVAEGDAIDEDVPPADAPIELSPPDPAAGGPYELAPSQAILLALQYRLDLRISEGSVYDAMRSVAVAANAFLPEVTLFGNARVGERRTIASAGQEDAEVRLDRGSYSALLRVDLPFDRTAERFAYRSEIIELERAVRDLQQLEDTIKLAVRSQLRGLVEARETLRIQAQAVALAERRVDSTSVLLELGRAEIRDVLEAQEALLSAQNALTAALVSYRISELELQRDLGLLEVNADGLWQEFDPTTLPGTPS
ncbi:MAG: TolC family protein [Opitutales bacterium]